MSRGWQTQARWRLPLALVLVLALTAVSVERPAAVDKKLFSCPRHCDCYDSVQELTANCTRDNNYTLLLTIQQGSHYELECSSEDGRELDSTELIALRPVLGTYAYDGAKIQNCKLPATPLMPLLEALRPAVAVELINLTLRKPRGPVPDASGLQALRQLRLYDPTVTAFPMPPTALEQLTVRNTPEPLRLDEKSLQAVNGAALLTLELSSDRIEELPPRLFATVQELRRLFLWGNKLRTLPADVFADLRHLESLDLSQNLLEAVPEALRGVGATLRDLNLSFNRLKSLSPGDFSGLRNVTKLDLTGNQLEELQSDAFAGLNALEELLVEDNKLKHIARDMFRGAAAMRLRRLELAGNLLTLREDEADGQSPFGALTELQDLGLARNRLDRLYDDWQYVLLRLTNLDLSRNRYTSLTQDSVNFLSTGNITIDFSYNRITAIEIYEVNSGGSAVTVLLHHNPLRCDCRLYGAVRLSRSAGARPRLLWDRAACAEPPALAGRPLADLPLERLVCELGECGAPADRCECRERPANRTLEVRCASAVALPRIDVVALGLADRVGRTELLLNGSGVSSLGADEPPPEVAVLDLRDNRLARVDAEAARRLLAPGRTLWLAGNPVECDCANEPFLTALKENRQQVSDYDLMKCASGELLRVVAPGRLCVWPTVALAAALAVFATSIAAAVLLYRRYETEAKVWLYARGLCLRWLTDDALDNDKRYDAFVSFSHLDEGFVVGELVPALEAGPPPLRLCVHVRDWPAGEWIPTQITRSVEQSRRTIVVLSPNFLQSVWGREEFRAAHAAALREGRARVVVVLYGEGVDARRLDPELRAYLQTNTYIKWGDPYFWHKLRLELPHRRGRRPAEHAPSLSELVAARKAGFCDALELGPAPVKVRGP